MVYGPMRLGNERRVAAPRARRFARLFAVARRRLHDSPHSNRRGRRLRRVCERPTRGLGIGHLHGVPVDRHDRRLRRRLQSASAAAKRAASRDLSISDNVVRVEAGGGRLDGKRASMISADSCLWPALSSMRAFARIEQASFCYRPPPLAERPFQLSAAANAAVGQRRLFRVGETSFRVCRRGGVSL